ncbi:hypothetical protein TRVA0_026S01310 [Trichomonascus vanleenenianus]|uniref:uncharacterized protein n=1 Tax=Trichomonascus vanleenenianus TaxID=2268995 RepID=UPI003ECAE667
MMISEKPDFSPFSFRSKASSTKLARHRPGPLNIAIANDPTWASPHSVSPTCSPPSFPAPRPPYSARSIEFDSFKYSHKHKHSFIPVPPKSPSRIFGISQEEQVLILERKYSSIGLTPLTSPSTPHQFSTMGITDTSSPAQEFDEEVDRVVQSFIHEELSALDSFGELFSAKRQQPPNTTSTTTTTGGTRYSGSHRLASHGSTPDLNSSMHSDITSLSSRASLTTSSTHTDLVSSPVSFVHELPEQQHANAAFSSPSSYNGVVVGDKPGAANSPPRLRKSTSIAGKLRSFARRGSRKNSAVASSSINPLKTPQTPTIDMKFASER